MEYKYVCPKCGHIEYFKTQKTVDRKSANKELCRVCKEKKKIYKLIILEFALNAEKRYIISISQIIKKLY